jgi:hypothetical protein
MALPVSVPYAFANATTTQNLSYLDSNFNTLAYTLNGIGNGTVTLSNVSITGGTIDANVSATSIHYGTSNVSITSSNGPVSINTAGNNAVYVDASQNVGIKVTNPASPLEIKTGTDVRLRIENNSDSNISAISSINDARSGYQPLIVNGSYLGFDIASSEKMRIDTSGNLLVGTTSAQAKFVTNSATSGASAKVITSFSGDVSTAALILQKNDNNTTTSQILAQFLINSGSNGSGQINANGSGAAAFGSYSDARLKENIVPLPSQLDKILALKPVEFDYIASEGGGHQVGFIAQDMQAVYSDAVGERHDGMLTITGWSKTEARLVKALQEAIAKIDALETRIATLETK